MVIPPPPTPSPVPAPPTVGSVSTPAPPIRLYAWASNGIIEQYNWNVRLYPTMDQVNRLLELSFLLAFLIYLLETEARQRQLAHRHQKVEKNFPIG